MAGEKILLADDDAVTTRFVSSLLQQAGYDVLIAEDGRQAYRMAVDHRPDLIVADLVMPYQDGYALLRALRTQNGLSDVPVVILSALDREEDIVRGLEEGADDYVVKPFNARELVVRIRKLLARSRNGH
jgi:DNA-binding response OmpR family regulator